jgi:hypothetical protein
MSHTPSRTVVYAARRIHTMDPARPQATHVAVRDGRVLGVGTPETLRGWGPFDLDERFAGRVLLPGFVEGHSHVGEGTYWRYVYCGFFDRTDPDGRVWPGARSIEAVVARLREAHASLAGELLRREVRTAELLSKFERQVIEHGARKEVAENVRVALRTLRGVFAAHPVVLGSAHLSARHVAWPATAPPHSKRAACAAMPTGTQRKPIVSNHFSMAKWMMETPAITRVMASRTYAIIVRSLARSVRSIASSSRRISSSLRNRS